MKGTTRKRGKTWTWQLTVTENGKRKHLTKGGFRTKGAAEDAMRVELERHKSGDRIEPSTITVRQHLEQWLPIVRASRKPSTASGYTTIVEKHLVPRIGDVQLSALRATDIARMEADLIASGLSAQTVRHVHAALSGALEAAVGDLILRNPARLVKRDQRPRVVSKPMQAWTADQVRVFLASIEGDRIACLFHVALFTGARRGELAGLRWDDVDLDSDRIQVQRSRVSVEYQVVEGDTKSGRARVVDIDAETVRVLKRWRARQLEERMAWGEAWTESGFLFTREDGTPIHPGSISQSFDRRVKASGLPRIRFHDLRHTHASLMLAAGVPAKVVQERLGHSSITITLDIYSHVAPGMQADAADRLGALVFGS